MADDTGFDTRSNAEKSGDADAPVAGDAGSNYLDSLFAVDPFDQNSVNKFSADTQQLKEWALAGPDGDGFAINEEGGQRYIDMCDRYLDGYAQIQSRLGQLVSSPKLGISPYAKQVSEHDVKVADGDPESIIPNLEDIKTGFIAFREAIEIAKSKYREEDAVHDQFFRAVERE